MTFDIRHHRCEVDQDYNPPSSIVSGGNFDWTNVVRDFFIVDYPAVPSFLENKAILNRRLWNLGRMLICRLDGGN